MSLGREDAVAPDAGREPSEGEQAEVPMRILLVDDDELLRRAVAAYLRACGHEVVCAANGADGLAALSGDLSLSLLVTNWLMPVMDGLALCRAARALPRPRYLPILLLTARSQKNDLVEGLNAGADAFLTKPVDFGEVDAHLRVVQRILRLEQELTEASEERAKLRELRAVMATARALTDRINNPMMVIFAQCEKLAALAGPADPERVRAAAEKMLEAAGQVSDCVHSLDQIVRPVIDAASSIGAILDLDESTGNVTREA